MEKCCGISGRTARRYISAFETFGEDAGTVSGTFDARTMYLLSYSDGKHDLVDIADRAGIPAWQFIPEIEALVQAGLLGTLE